MNKVSRRKCLSIAGGVAAFSIAGIRGSHSALTASDFTAILGGVQSDPSLALSTLQFSELAFRQEGPTDAERRGNSNLPRRWHSDKKLSSTAISLIIAFEVSNQKTYESAYSHPIWPGGDSGATVGIGYDLGYQSLANIQEDWDGLVANDVITRLQSAQGTKGDAAKGAARRINDVTIGWSPAYSNFTNILALYAGETVRYFPNCRELSDDSFGALVSLVYNRGSSTKPIPGDTQDRRREMREIKMLCTSRMFDQIPEKIRNMKRLWLNDNKARGLLTRRELEASLFELGLQ